MNRRQMALASIGIRLPGPLTPNTYAGDIALLGPSRQALRSPAAERLRMLARRESFAEWRGAEWERTRVRQRPVWYGVWCVEDCAWCQGTIGPRAYAERELPSWASGEAADVDPTRFHYEIRRYTK